MIPEAHRISKELRPMRDVLRSRLGLVERRISAINSVQRLLRIPGIGKVNAFTIYLETDGIERFETEKHFFSYGRLVPGAADSAGSRHHKPSRDGNRYLPSRDGNRYLKLCFSHAATRAIPYYTEVKGFYRKKKRKKPEAIARALVAKEIARIVYHVLKKEQDFNGRFKGQPLSRLKQEQWPLLPSPSGITEAASVV